VWRKSSFSGGGNGNCLEVAASPGGLIRLRESDQPTQIVTTTPATWAVLLGSVKAGRFR
jgi:Domain of unknown function (DUF397)